MALILFPQLYSDTLDRAALAQERAQRHRRTEEALRLARDCLYHRLVPLAKATGIAMGPLTPVTDLRFDGVAAADTVVPRLVLGQQAPQFTRDVWLIRASAVSTLDVMFSRILAEEQLPVNPSPSLFKSSVERLTAWRENPLHSLCVCVGAAWDSNCTAALGYYIMLVDAVPPDRLLPAPLLREPPPRPALLDKAPRLRQSGTIKSLGPPLSVSGKLRKSGTKKRSPPLDAHQLTLTDMADSSSRAKEQKRSALVAQMTEDSGQPAQKKQKGDGAAASEEFNQHLQTRRRELLAQAAEFLPPEFVAQAAEFLPVEFEDVDPTVETFHADLRTQYGGRVYSLTVPLDPNYADTPIRAVSGEPFATSTLDEDIPEAVETAPAT